jgi:hypothetical protein
VRTRRQRSSDIKLVAGATVGVVLAGAFIAVALLVASGSDRPPCGRLPVGPADTVRTDLERGGAFFQTGGEGCSYWLALADGDIVAYRATQPSGCTLAAGGDTFRCGGEVVDPAELAQYPVSIVERGGVDTVVVDLTDAAAP